MMIRVVGVTEWEHEFEHQSDLYEPRVWEPENDFGWNGADSCPRARGWADAWMTQWIYGPVIGCTGKVRLSAPAFSDSRARRDRRSVISCNGRDG